MSCNACMVEDLRFEVKADGELNCRMFSSVAEHLERKGVLLEAESDRFVLKEEGMRDFLDFCRDHMEAEYVSFRAGDEVWRPIAEKEIFCADRRIFCGDKKIYVRSAFFKGNMA
ncbi:hypothetical protein [Cytobacillus firmus]|uniref:hypothetical protein n=1 Tax=Cytobacillus firmus TaxID=1399 RepID=UPI0024951327|nr:hypothetical protein [Cytobacillus firmus]